MTVIAVCGLQREAVIAAKSGVTAIAGGGDAAGLAARLEKSTAGATGVISVGIAGGLAHGLQPGACILGTEVIAGGERLATDSVWRMRMKEKLPDSLLAPIAGVSAIAATRAAKAALRELTGAAAVDMESHIAGHFARGRKIPFAILRVIADPADAVLPPAALCAMAADGSIDRWAVLRSVAARPGQIPALIRTARQSAIAFGALLRCVHLLGNGFSLPDIG